MIRFNRRVSGIFAAVALVCGCSKPPSEKEVVDAMISWIGTADMASQAWLNHTTFDRYTRQTLELSAQMLDEQASQLGQVASRDSLGVGNALAHAAQSMTTIAGLIAAHDAPDVQVQLDSLRAAKKIVLALSDSLDKKRQ